MAIKRIDETTFGVYLWKMDDGSYLANEDRDKLSIQAERGDIKRMAEIRKVAHGYLRANGYAPEGSPEFFSGYRKVTDAEYREQQDRMNEGYIPDEFDVAAYAEELRDREDAE